MLKKPFRYLSRVIFIAAIFCLLLQACTTIPTKLKNLPITSPGQVLTNSSSPTKLSDSLNNSCRHSHGSIVNPITAVSSPSGYGLDEFYSFPSDQMINMGTSCYFGSESQCKLIIDMMEKWAKANAAQVRSSSYKNSKYWNDTLTVNLRVVRPFIGA
jgi:hypothetical protein